MMSTQLTVIVQDDVPLARKAAEILERAAGAPGGTVTLGCDASLPPEAYRIAVADDVVRIDGGDGRGIVYGVGRFLRTSQTGAVWEGVSVPEKPIRAMYFASHFGNWYHVAPVEDVIAYIEELALWGCNCLSVWFDMHHFDGIDDPAAQRMVQRLRTLLEAANTVGIGASLTMLANEAYASSPEPLRADWTAGHDGYFRPPGGHYHVEICPSKPGGMEAILACREEVLKAFSGIDFDYIWIWPYDQGGCTCSECAPWGANGFLRVAEPLAELIRSHFPETQIILSTWYFDRFINGEWAGLSDAFSAVPPTWVDYLLIDDFGGFPQYPLEHGVPGGLSAVGFPEISMEGNSPWGGYGAHPRPAHWQAYWHQVRNVLSGSFPYSEGIYEDLNKVLMLQLEWCPNRDVDDIAREYATGHFGVAVADDFVRAIHMMERDCGTGVSRRGETPEFKVGPMPHAHDCRDLMHRLDLRLPDSVRESWRWRLYMCRADIDAELADSGGVYTPLLHERLAEITRIYCVDASARDCVRPVLGERPKPQ